ncbi:MAG: alpha/beta hydrolase [Rhodobacterales bacterium]|nr:alpha/beta hydrolase [Rhodobacterales bacterium]
MLKVLICIVIGIAVAALIVHAIANAREARAEVDFPPEGMFLDVDGTRVHAVVMGAGPDLVLIHGSSGNARDMTFSLAPRLASRYRVIVFDRPGLGYTERLNDTGATLVQQATLLRAAARQLGAPTPILMGQSYGGAVALAWAAHYPGDIAALIPVAAASNPWDTPLSLFYRITSSRMGQALLVPLLTAFVPESVVENAVESVFAPQTAPKGYAAHIGARMTLRRGSLRANGDQRKNILAEIKDLVPFYQNITASTEIVHGTADTTVGLSIHSNRLVHQIAGARLTMLSGIGHMVHHSAEDAVVAAIDRAVERAGL